MTIEEHICSSGVAVVPDLKGGKECYSDSEPYEKLVITQIPSPGELVSEGQTIINVVTEDGNGNATICTHYLNVTADNPAPTLECPDPITTWVLPGGYEVPDFTTEVKVIGGCTVYDDLVITQSPAAGTLLTDAGVHTITITVKDKFGHSVVCSSTTITLEEASDPMVDNPVTPPPPPPVVTPQYVYASNMLAYWKLDIHSFTTDYGSGARTLTNNGASSQVVTGVVCNDCGPGPLFRCGSAYFNHADAYLSRADDTGLKLMGASFTIRFLVKLVDLISPVCFFPISKQHGSGRGYRIIICHGPFVQGQLANGTDILLTPGGAAPLSMNVWQQVALTLDISTGSMKIYVDGVLKNTQTLAGFSVGNSETTPLTIGPTIFGNQVEGYVDEVGIWTEAWSASRVLEDYHLLNCTI